MMIPRTLEPEVMDTAEEATDYNAMDHSAVNRVFVADFLRAIDDPDFDARSPRILDTGTGTALIPIELCRQTERCLVTAVDLSAEMLHIARTNIAGAGMTDRIDAQHIDAKRLPYEDGCFEAVISNSIVHHIPQPILALAEMLRALRPGGLLFVRDLLRPDDVETVEHLVRTYAGGENDHQQQMFRDSLHAALCVDEVREILSELGRSSDWVAQTTDRHWTIVGRT